MDPPSSADTVLTRVGPTTQMSGLPADLLAQAALRLRRVALLYAFVFFMSDPLGAILLPEERAVFFDSILRAAPSLTSIAAALAVVALTFSRRLPVTTLLRIGLVFEVVGSYGIAAAQFLDPSRWTAAPPWGGLSWVAVWMLSFTVLIPTPPRVALVAALASASAVPVVAGTVMALDLVSIELSAVRFFFQLVLPYLLVVLIADVGARLVYHLGSEVRRARELGSYQLIERLDQGGMGEVWRARHRLLARPAAIKLMRPEVLGTSAERRAQMHARFEREAQATSSLRSPHTVELYDFGIADDGAFYYVMELLDGFNLGTLVDRFGPVPPSRAVHLLLQLCHSLGEAHGGGLVHRDIKPANVFVCRYGRDVDFVKVLDFGLAKWQSLDDPGALNTAPQLAGGTPAFMSPEQVLGDRAVDARTDIYAAGCLAYWLVTGQLVFTGRTAMETMMQHVRDLPTPPSQRTELPIAADFDAIVLECLAKDPGERPPSADALAQRLEQLRGAGEWGAERAAAWWDVHHPGASGRAVVIAPSV